jgi:hypothetical protein
MAKDPERFADKEANRRFEAALRAGFKTPAKPHSEMKLGKPTADKKRKRPISKPEPR